MKKRICKNCKNKYILGNKYCIYCGAKLGKPQIVEIEDNLDNNKEEKPISRVHECKTCGYTWYTYNTIDIAEFCPECGNPSPGIEIKNIDLHEIKSVFKLTEEQELELMCKEVFKDENGIYNRKNKKLNENTKIDCAVLNNS